MRFISTKRINGAKIEAIIPFKKDRVKNVAILDDNYISMDYELSDWKTKFPIDIYNGDASFVLDLTKKVLSTSAFIDINLDDESLFECAENGDLEFKVDMNDGERNDLMMFLLKNFISLLP